MKKNTVAMLVLSMGLMVTACGGSDPEIQTLEPEPIIEDVTDDTNEEESTEEIILEGLQTIGERKEVDGQMQSYLTGEWKDSDVVKRRNLAVMIPNNKPALPQYGLSKASVIYEAPVEGRITRLMGIFEDYDDIDRIGPVRSARDYYVYEAMAFDSIYVNWGLAVPFVSPIINTDQIDNVSQAVEGIDVPASEAFDRVSRPGYATEFTGYLFIDGYNDAVDRLGYEKEYRDRFQEPFKFADDNYLASYDECDDATKIYPGGTGSNSSGYGSANPVFEYNSEDRLYYRSQYGSAQIDECTGEQLAVTNVVFKICHGEVREPSDKDYLAFGITGTGDGYVFTNGKVIKGTWERKDNYSPNVFYDEDGNEIVLNQGKTWICNIWKEYADCLSYE